MVFSTIPFYFATLEQYYTGEIVLQIINGVDDGSIVYCAMALLAAYYGCIPLFATKYTIWIFEDYTLT